MYTCHTANTYPSISYVKLYIRMSPTVLDTPSNIANDIMDLLLAHLDEILITAPLGEASDVQVGAAQLASHAPCPHHCPPSEISLGVTE